MISIDNSPNIPGLEFRQFSGESDFSAMAEVITASEAADGQARQVDTDDVANAFQHLENCNPAHDLVIAEVDGRMVGYVRAWWEEAEPGERWYCHMGFLMPEWRRKRIGSALLSAAENRLHEIASTHPSNLAKVFQVSVADSYIGRMALMEHRGYKPARFYFSMVRLSLDEIPQFPLPAGLEVRPVSPEQYPAIWSILRETSRDEWGHRELTEQDYQEWLESPSFQPHLWQVAWDTSTSLPVGTVLTYIHHEENKQYNRRRGYTEGIGVARTWRRRGVARALISLSLQAQKDAGMTESALVVDSENENDALRLYESCGFQVVKRDTLYRKLLEP
jgi:mycothiol synthase